MPPNGPPSRFSRPGAGAGRGVGIWVAGGAALAAAVAAFLWIQSSSRPSPSAGLAMGARVPSISQPATSGQMLSLDQFRGSKVVVYFYEGAT